MSMQRTGGTVPLHGLGGWRASMGADRINTEDTSGTSQSPGGVTLSRSCCRPCRRLLHVLFNEKREFYGGGGGNLQIFTLLWNDFFFPLHVRFPETCQQGGSLRMNICWKPVLKDVCVFIETDLRILTHDWLQWELSFPQLLRRNWALLLILSVADKQGNVELTIYSMG